jgi:hypothetical protein
MLTKQILIGLDTSDPSQVFLVANYGGRDVEICERPFASEDAALAWFEARFLELLGRQLLNRDRLTRAMDEMA